MTTSTSPPAASPPAPAAAPPAYPVRVRGELDPATSRWLWLVKWVLAVPHYVVLVFLWAAFGVLTVVAFVAILVSGRYPRSIFDVNVGVLRWSWRVAFYTNAAFATDRYPPFTLAEVADYPAHLEIEYPERLSRGLVLVKSWLLAIPHLIVVGIFTSGAWWLWQGSDARWSWGAGGLIGLLALVAVVVLAVTGRYPRSLFDFLLGMDRWVLRVAAYTALMTDDYPPFRIDLGGEEPTAPPGTPTMSPAADPAVATGWSAGPVLAVVIGGLLSLAALPPATGGVTALVADSTARDAAGYLTTAAAPVSTGGYVLSSEPVVLAEDPSSAYGPSAALGTVRVRATSTDGEAVFVGIAPRAAADSYVAGVAGGSLEGLDQGVPVVRERGGSAPAVPAPAAAIWVAQDSGRGTRTVTWTPRAGDWTIVVASDPPTAGTSATVDVGATVPDLGTWGLVLLAGAALLLVIGAAVVALGIATAHRHRTGAAAHAGAQM
jgi:uncharacterized protein DUF4389